MESQQDSITTGKTLSDDSTGVKIESAELRDDLPVSPHRTWKKSSDADESISMDTARSNESTKNNVHIIPNDRKIPMHLQDDVEEILGISRLDKDSIFHSKGSQTRISGIRTMSNFLDTCDFGHPATVLNPTPVHHPKHQFSCITYESELSLTRSYLHNVHCNYQRLKLRFHKLHEDYYKLIRVAGELTNALEISARGSPVDLPTTLEACMNVYPDLFNQNIRDDNTEMRSLRSEIDVQHQDFTDSKQPILGIVPVSPKFFDYKKIKLHLINGNVRTKLLLLQALRWKITLSQPAERDEAIHAYTSSDLMGLHGQIASDSGKSILPYLLIPLDIISPHPVQQSAARLLNTLASLRCGRDYLSVGPTVLNVVVQCLDTIKAETVDVFTCDMIIAMLQKMSLRRQQRLYMIGMGLVEWLVYHLKSEHREIGTYRLEYTIALLMNLSLHREAQVRAATMTTLVLSTLTELLSSAHLAALPYVNGTLNNFLANHTINEEAKKMGLESVLEYHRRRSTGEIKKHLEHILRRHRRETNEAVEDNLTIADEDIEELDVLENELDEMDPVKVHAGELFGEALLATCYSIIGNDRQRFIFENEKISPRTSDSNVSKPKKLESNGNSKNVNEISHREEKISPRAATATAANSSVTLVSAHESAAEVEDRTSSIASIGGNEEKYKTPGPRKIVNENICEEAFLSKPRITRTPPQSAILRVFSPLNDERTDDDPPE